MLRKLYHSGRALSIREGGKAGKNRGRGDKTVVEKEGVWKNNHIGSVRTASFIKICLGTRYLGCISKAETPFTTKMFFRKMEGENCL